MSSFPFSLFRFYFPPTSFFLLPPTRRRPRRRRQQIRWSVSVLIKTGEPSTHVAPNDSNKECWEESRTDRRA
ncbi:hypothetical protein LguiA_017973 [Lonicera macranthoides]